MSKAPTGITITRNGGYYTASWKCGDNNYNNGQQFQYKINSGSWRSVSIYGSTREKSVYVNPANYFPHTKSVFYSLTIRIRGKVSGSNSWSSWTSKTFTNYVPNVPSLTASLNDQLSNRCTFTWNLTTEATNSRPYWHVRWQTILVKESNITDGSKLPWKSSTLGWNTGAGSSASSITLTEDTAILANASYTRWFRVCARGARGSSAWRYAKHVYARPYQARIESATVANLGAGLTCTVRWKADYTASHPIDSVTVQYLMTVPNEGLTCPSGAQWEDANTSADTSYYDAAKFSIDNRLDKDECLFVRVNTKHDSNTIYSVPKVAKVGNLKDPTDLSYQVDNTNHTLTSVSVDNNSEVPDSFIAIVYKAGSRPEDETVVGIIPHGASQPLVTPVQCPDWSGESAFSIGAYAAVGTYEANSIGYTVKAEMRSASTIWVGGAVPVAPENVNVVQSPITGTATVTWDWTWEAANYAQLSWTDHEDAWESTDEPEIYNITKQKATKWNISGLDLGTKWYIAVRLVSGNPEDENAIYSPWSDMKDIILSSAPNVPSLNLSARVITEGEEITASWDYVSNDGTGQISAEVCETVDTPAGTQYGTYFLSQDTTVVVEEDGEELLNGKTYYEKTGEYTYEKVDDVSADDNPVENEWYEYQQSIAHTTYETEAVIDTETLGWGEGETHSLSVRVTSESNRTTDWSNPVSIVVAEALECSIAETSLVDEQIEVNPRSFSGDLITFETEMEEVFTKLQVDLDPIQSGSGTPSPSNVRPISGHDDVGVGVVGKNIFDESVLLQASGWTETDGVYRGYNSALYDKYYPRSNMIPLNCKENTSYTLSMKYRNATLGGNVYFVFFYSDGTGESINRDSQTEVQLTLTSNPNKTLVGVGFSYASASIVYIREMQIEQGTTATTYEPYTKTDYTDTLPTTVYGGTLDVVSGVLTVEYGYETIDENSTLYINGTIAGTSTEVKYTPSVAKANGEYNFISDRFAVNSSTSAGSVRGRSNSGNIFFRVPDSVTTVAQAQAWFGNNPTQICYELATTQTYQLTPQQIDTLLGVNNVYSDCNMDIRVAESMRNIHSLKEMPLTVKLNGVSDNVTATVTLERTQDYHMDRPDGTRFDGHEGEIVYLTEQNSNEDIIINQTDLIGLLDDEAPYRVYVTFKDVYGQSMSDSVDFEVHWNHQAIVPEASVEIDEENLIAKLTPIAPTGTGEGDTCDIYRLSADRPELIVKDAEFGTQYVDPYPAIGEFGGHRFVFKTVNGDYITEDNGIAWVDTGEEDGDILESEKAIIDFDGNQLLLYYNVDVGHQWDKDFQQTKYLGGSIQGDWNAGVSRSGSVSATMITITDAEQIKMMRALAVYTGVCHVRTTDGSSYTADVQVSEDRDHDDYGKLASFSLTVTRVDTETLDGLTYAQWSEGEE